MRAGFVRQVSPKPAAPQHHHGDGAVAPGTAFDPSHIANAFWDLAQDALGAFRPEIVFKGA